MTVLAASDLPSATEGPRQSPGSPAVPESGQNQRVAFCHGAGQSGQNDAGHARHGSDGRLVASVSRQEKGFVRARILSLGMAHSPFYRFRAWRVFSTNSSTKGRQGLSCYNCYYSINYHNTSSFVDSKTALAYMTPVAGVRE